LKVFETSTPGGSLERTIRYGANWSKSKGSKCLNNEGDWEMVGVFACIPWFRKRKLSGLISKGWKTKYSREKGDSP